MNPDVHLEVISLFVAVALLAVLNLQGCDGKPHTTRKAIKYQYKSFVVEVATWQGKAYKSQLLLEVQSVRHVGLRYVSCRSDRL